MNITHAQWANADQTAIAATIDGSEYFVPNDPANRHRQAIAEWEADGNEIEAYFAPPVPLPPLSPRQLRLGLLSTGTTEADVDTLISAITDDQERAWSQIEWKHATSFDRNHALIESFGPALGYSPAEIDALWTWASEL